MGEGERTVAGQRLLDKRSPSDTSSYDPNRTREKKKEQQGAQSCSLGQNKHGIEKCMLSLLALICSASVGMR
jgi:hypothetical protein